MKARYFSHLGTRLRFTSYPSNPGIPRQPYLRTFRSRQNYENAAAQLLLAEHGRRRAQVRVLLHRLPNHEVLPSVSTRTPTAVGSARANMAIYYDGLHDWIASRFQQNDAILVVVDRLTKMAHFIVCQQTITAEQTAQLFIANVIRLHELPTAIISDRDPKFTSNFWRHLWDQFGTKLHFSSAYHPQTDGQTERVNQTMEQLIQTTCTDPQTWEKSLPLLEFAYNNAPSATTHQPPFFLNYGQDPV
ncbi:hypothetical protein CLOP_g16205 [Closterium sp. NIES-67]|nr:hypothetical protein CLOP_g16205 [Closterium sp. NIES-67]